MRTNSMVTPAIPLHFFGRRLVSTLVVGVFCAVLPAMATVTAERHETYPLQRGGVVALSNVNGSITIGVWDRDEVTIDAVIKADDQAGLDAIEIEIAATPSRVAIDTNFSRSSSYERNGRREVEYTVVVPRWARLDEIESVNGSVEIVDVMGGTHASTVNGQLSIQRVGGDIDAETVNGRLSIELTDASQASKISANAVNGSVRVVVPRGAGLEVDAETVHGRIEGNLGLEVERPRYGPGASMSGRVGGGGLHLDVETVNGSIEISQN